MKLKHIMMMAVAALAAASCTEDSPKTIWPEGEGPDKEPVQIERGAFAKGADVSWVTELEKAGYTFTNAAGTEKELMELLRDDCGVDAIRLRVFVNPERDKEINGWCNIDDVIVKARRAHALGLRLMIDFHFSDRWADPGQQFIPSEWENYTLEEVKSAMTDHVNTLMTALQRYDIEPEWVQIGNETRTGMMWPLGEYQNGDNFTQMVNAGYDAVKAVFPEALVIVHLDCGNEPYLYTRLFGKLEAEGGKYDMIGMSLYPGDSSWQKDIDDCIANIRKVQGDYGKPVMLCEIGFDYTQPETAGRILSDMMEKGKAVDLKGIFWWEPEAPAERGYTKGCFDNGTPTAALDAFKN
ncbi:MAG: arabinogalactan endo-1,4-beta-galactosidase [Muribaculaceae bacterium]|nr:arabinogalactan endo-1,4-beta-galactosidase [Muribaculaceae bacterium]